MHKHAYDDAEIHIQSPKHTNIQKHIIYFFKSVFGQVLEQVVCRA